MELKLELEIENLFGGDGFKRIIEEKEIKLSRTKSKKTTKYYTQVSTESGVDEEHSQIVKKEVQTFDMQEGYPVFRLGGIHGKLWGHLRACGKLLADLGEEGFDSKAFVDRFMMSVNITPIYCVIKDHQPMKVAEIPQITSGISRAMIIQKYDYITRCKVDLNITFPEAYRKQVIKLLKQMEEMAGLNKRRSTLKILNREILKD